MWGKYWFKKYLIQNFVFDAQKKMKINKFCDVTLINEDNKRFMAHKVILYANSVFFQNMLMGMNSHHPFIFMRGVKSVVLEALIDFIYEGETKLVEVYAESFFKLTT